MTFYRKELAPAEPTKNRHWWYAAAMCAALIMFAAWATLAKAENTVVSLYDRAAQGTFRVTLEVSHQELTPAKKREVIVLLTHLLRNACQVQACVAADAPFVAGEAELELKKIGIVVLRPAKATYANLSQSK